MPTFRQLQDRIRKLLEGEGVSFGSDALAGDLAAEIDRRGVLLLDQEEPDLPRGLTLGPMSLGGLWVAATGQEGYLLHVKVAEAGSPAVAEAVVRAMVAAYNELYEIHEDEADVDDNISAGLAELCREEIDSEIEAGVTAERDRCLDILTALRDEYVAGSGDPVMIESLEAATRTVKGGEAPNPFWPEVSREGASEVVERSEVAPAIEAATNRERVRCLAVVDWLLGCYPKNWDFARRMTTAAREDIARGSARPGKLSLEWGGANDLPNPEPVGVSCEWPDCGEIALCRSGNFENRLVCGEHFKLTNGAAGSSVYSLDAGGAVHTDSPEAWPKQLVVDWRMCGALGDMPMLYPPFGWFWPHRHQMGRAYEEAARRWEEEPKLRARLAAVNDAMQGEIASVLRALGLPDHARSASPQAVMRFEVLPAITILRARLEKVTLTSHRSAGEASPRTSTAFHAGDDTAGST